MPISRRAVAATATYRRLSHALLLPEQSVELITWPCLPRRRALRRRFERGRVFDVVLTLGYNLSPAILDAGYAPAWQVEAAEAAELRTRSASSGLRSSA
jgi:hypothetical protein